jgi:RHH-type proline utilization regulon transcriptional repressor/proline dehydrogenase/delta 1-pyrroline-5-carboxylate dehydrogenase
LRGWDGLGLAVQAYQKRALPVIAWLGELGAAAEPAHSRASGEGRLLGHGDQARAGTGARRLSRVHAQRRHGHVLSRLRAALLARAQRSIRNSRPTMRIRFPLSRSSPADADFEYQRLHGMGEALYELYRE